MFIESSIARRGYAKCYVRLRLQPCWFRWLNHSGKVVTECYNSVLINITIGEGIIIKPIASFLSIATFVHGIALYSDYRWASPAHPEPYATGKTINLTIQPHLQPQKHIETVSSLPAKAPAKPEPVTEQPSDKVAVVTQPTTKPSLTARPVDKQPAKPLQKSRPPVSDPTPENTATAEQPLPHKEANTSPAKLSDEPDLTTTIADQDNNANPFEQWLASLQFAINQRKAYPYQARRRNVSGEVEVMLEVSPDGSLIHVEIARGRKIFHSSTLNAVHSAFPMPPTLKDEPVTVHLTVHYSLR